jgi:hypothetical protein
MRFLAKVNCNYTENIYQNRKIISVLSIEASLTGMRKIKSKLIRYMKIKQNPA